MDITDTLAPKSDQLDAVDLLGGPQTFTIAGVKAGSSPEQPVEVKLAEFPRVWRPGKSMRRVLAAAWTPHSSEWTGRRVTLFCDPDVRFGGLEVGGIRISHMSDLDGPKKVPLLISKGKSQMFTVQPLVGEPVMSPAQSARVKDLMRELAITGNAALALCAETIGRKIGSAKELTQREADLVIAAMDRMSATQPDDAEPVDADGVSTEPATEAAAS